MTKNYKVYKHAFPNNKVYIGITNYKNPNRRWNDGHGYAKQPKIYNAILKYGWNNIKHEILFDNLTKEEACQKEIELIALYKSNQRESGYNVSSGGESGWAGTIPWNKGKHLSEETRKKISQNHSKHNKGKRLTEETKAKISNTLKQHPTRYWQGKHRSEETKRKLSEAQRGKPKPEKATAVICIETNEQFNSIQEAMNKFGIGRGHIGAVCRGKRKTAGGYHWRYA